MSDLVDQFSHNEAQLIHSLTKPPKQIVPLLRIYEEIWVLSFVELTSLVKNSLKFLYDTTNTDFFYFCLLKIVSFCTAKVSHIFKKKYQ